MNQREEKQSYPSLTNEEMMEVIEEIRIYMSQHLASDLCARRVSAKFDLSVITLNQIFWKFRNQSYSRYLFKFRIHKAFSLLRKGLRVKAVMLATGYKYRSTFNRNFKSIYRHPPVYFRRHKLGHGKKDD